MKRSPAVLAQTICVTIASTLTALASPIPKKESENLDKVHQRWWGTKVERRFEQLPKKGMVEKNRRPWSGYIYPDKHGGCINVLRVYDRAFHYGRPLCVNYERRDIEIHKSPQERRGPLLGLVRVTRVDTPDWAGHCNGWAAAAIRHAEPKRNVVRNGVTFTPATIKGLLAELYVFGDIEMLSGSEQIVHPATFHLILANWIGRGQHPIAMDNTLGEEIWNYPVYAYKSSAAKRGNNRVEVKTNIGFVNSVDSEYEEAPKRYKFMYFHYYLDLDATGRIVGGGYYRDSERIDLVWVPLQPAQGGTAGNKEGNPYMNVHEVLSLWRDSVPKEDRDQWYNINPWPEDAITAVDEEKTDETTPEPADSDESSEPQDGPALETAQRTATANSAD